VWITARSVWRRLPAAGGAAGCVHPYLPSGRTANPAQPYDLHFKLHCNLSRPSIYMRPVEGNQAVGLRWPTTTPPETVPQGRISPRHFQESGRERAQANIDAGRRTSAVRAPVVGRGWTSASGELLLFTARAESRDDRYAATTRFQFVITRRQPNAPHGINVDSPTLGQVADIRVGDEFTLGHPSPTRDWEAAVGKARAIFREREQHQRSDEAGARTKGVGRASENDTAGR